MAVLAATCCGPQGDPTPVPQQARAVAMIWRDLFAQVKAPPPIYWRRDSCGAANGAYAPLPWCSFDDDGTPVDGLFVPYYVEVGAPWGTGTIADTALPHELLHAAIGDPDHTLPQWQQLPTPDELRARGLQ